MMNGQHRTTLYIPSPFVGTTTQYFTQGANGGRNFMSILWLAKSKGL